MQLQSDLSGTTNTLTSEVVSLISNTQANTNNLVVMNSAYIYELVHRMTTINFVDIDSRPTGSPNDLLIILPTVSRLR